MRGALFMKSQSKKNKWNTIKSKKIEDDGLSSDDEMEVSEDMLGKWYQNSKYIIYI